MNKQKSLLCVILVLVLLTTMVLTGCGSKTDDTTTPGEPEDTSATDTQKEDSDTEDSDNGLYSQIDLSEPYTVNMYVLGDVPADMELVLTEINKILEPQYNTTLDIRFLAWSDYETKYSLVLAGGEDVDLMYTSSWCYYYTEAAKGAFIEITDDFLFRAMPQTKQTQAEASWAQVNLNGKIYAVPKNSVQPQSKYVAIRDDLREKYDIEPLTDWTSLENYLVTIAEKETPESGIWGIAASEGNPEFRAVWDQQFEILTAFAPYCYLYNDGAKPAADDFFLYWDSQYFRDFAKRMKYLCDKGVWPEDALTNTVSVNDAFANGQGAAIAWNHSVFNYGKQVEENLGVTAGYYDLTKDKVVMPMEYVNDCFAIAAGSKNPERAGMVLDLLKNDTELYRLLVGGIEGKHYINIDDKYRQKGPDADKYPWDAFPWGIRREDLEPDDIDPRQIAIDEDHRTRMKDAPLNGFVFDREPVKNELAAVEAIIDEYVGMLELGLADDVDATIDEMVSRMEQAGLEAIKNEGLRQYQKWLEENPE